MFSLANLSDNWIIFSLLLLGFGLFIDFWTRYFIHAKKVNYGLSILLKSLPDANDVRHAEIKSELANLFDGTTLDHLWKEYEESLHEQFEISGAERRIRAIRATAPAATYFNVERAFEGLTSAEYFKHLPGILTGIGIICTFTGLITGLMEFHPDLAKPEELQAGLGNLFSHIRQAFTVSGIAIFCAMLVTIVEKVQYANHSKLIAKLADILDSYFRSGVGEEYLSDLLRNTEDNATQTRQLKEAMVDDLRILLTNLTDRQILATEQISARQIEASQKFSQNLGETIRDSLREPLEKIAATVRETAQSDQKMVGNVLEKLMTSFMTQMRESMGGQMGELSELMKSTAAAIANVEHSLTTLVNNLKETNAESTTQMQSAIHDLIRSLGEQQQKQSDTVTDNANRIFVQLEGALAQMSAAQQESERKANEERAAAAELSQDTLNSLKNFSGEMLDKLAVGATGVSNALVAFQRAVDRLSAATNDLSEMDAQSRRAIETIRAAVTEMGGAIVGISSAAAALGTATTQLQFVAEAQKGEAAARTQWLAQVGNVVRDMDAVSARFGSLTAEIKDKLDVAFDGFGEGVTKVISMNMTAYSNELGNAVRMLKAAMEELSSYSFKD